MVDFPVGDNAPFDNFPIIDVLDGTELIAVHNKGTYNLYMPLSSVAGYGLETASFSTIAALRANTSVASTMVWVIGYYADGDGGEGVFRYDPSDTTTADDSGTVIVDAAFHRWKRNFSREVVNPLMFGACGTRDATKSAYDTNGLTAAFAYWLNTGSCHTLDLLGRKYWLTTTLTGPSAYLWGKRITNGSISVTSAFTGTMIDISSALSLNGIRFDNLTLTGHDDTQVPYATGIILLDNTHGVDITECELVGFTTFGIRDLNTAAATEVRVAFCRISGRNDGGQSAATLVDIAGWDSEICHNILREGSPLVSVAGAVTFIGNHLYNYITTAEDYIVCNEGKNVHIVGNVLDDGYIKIVESFGSYQNVNISDNRFLATTSTFHGGINVFVNLVPSEANVEVYGMIINNNSFRCESGTISDPVYVDTTGGTINADAVYGFYMDNNVYYGVTSQYSHPSALISFAAATSGNSDLASSIPFGTIKYAFSRGETITSGAGAAHWLSTSGTTVTVTTASAITGYVIVQGTVNNDIN